MDLKVALKGMLDAQNALRSKEGVLNPSFMSENMMRLSQYTGAVEEHLAGYEKDFEITYATRLRYFMVELKMNVTASERQVEIETAELKGQIKYLTRLVSSSWRQVGVIQSRVNHLVKEAQTQI